MTPCFSAYGRALPGAIRTVASVAVLAACATGCRNDPAPPWGYPELRSTLGALSRTLEEGCDETAPESCVDDLDRLGALADRAFGEVLDHELLDAAYVDALGRTRRARELRVAAGERARSRQDPHDLRFRRAVAAERLAYRRLLAALRDVRTAPPPGDGTDPV